MQLKIWLAGANCIIAGCILHMSIHCMFTRLCMRCGQSIYSSFLNSYSSFLLSSFFLLHLNHNFQFSLTLSMVLLHLSVLVMCICTISHIIPIFLLFSHFKITSITIPFFFFSHSSHFVDTFFFTLTSFILYLIHQCQFILNMSVISQFSFLPIFFSTNFLSFFPLLSLLILSKLF